MSATNQFEDDLLSLIFENIQTGNVGDASGLQPSASAGSWHISLHTATLSDTTTDQDTSEAAYTSYARQAVARSAAGWSVASGVADNDSAVTFPQATGGSETETDFGIGFALTSTGYLNMFGALDSSLAVSSGITPEFAAGDIDITLD